MEMKWPYIVLLTVGCYTLFTGCDRETTSVLPGDRIRARVVLPGSYAVPASAKSAEPQTRATEHPELNDDMLELLDDGSTLWLAVYERSAEGDYSNTPTALQSYVVRRSENGYSTLYTCEVNPDGSVKSESDEPLYLDVGKTYKFRAVSPARELIDGEKLHVNNGDYLLSTDDRYTQTEAKEITIGGSDGGTSGITYVYLNPLLHQTAQMRFTIETGENVHHLTVLPAGIEISGIQDDVVNNNQYNWMISEPLKMYLGSKHSRITIKDFTTKDDCITGQTSVLPTDAVSSSIVVLLNLSVNGINSQYTLMLNGMTLEPAYSYNFNIKVKVENGVTVAVWQNQSWDWDMDLQ